MTLVNGIEADFLNVHDRGLQYGDGVFETIRVTDGHPQLWKRHMKRLVLGCARLAIRVPDTALLAHEAGRLCDGAAAGALKIIVTRGEGGRGYRPPQQHDCTRIISLHPPPEYPEEYRTAGVAVRFCDTRLAVQPRLAGIKHLNRLEQVLARNEWTDTDIAEGLMLDEGDRVIEGTMSNLFIVHGDRLLTPDLTRSGVAGVMRELILETVTALGIAYEIRDLGQMDVLGASEVFLSNSLIGIWPVRRIDAVVFAPGALTGRIAAALGEQLVADTVQ